MWKVKRRRQGGRISRIKRRQMSIKHAQGRSDGIRMIWKKVMSIRPLEFHNHQRARSVHLKPVLLDGAGPPGDLVSRQIERGIAATCGRAQQRSRPSRAAWLATAGLSIASLVASLSLLTTSAGAPFGRKNAFQVTTSKSVSPCSCAVGKSGRTGERMRDNVASRLDLTCLDDLDRASDVGAVIIDLTTNHIIQGWPAAAIGHMRDVDPDRRVNLCTAQMCRRAGPSRTELQLRGIRLSRK